MLDLNLVEHTSESLISGLLSLGLSLSLCLGGSSWGSLGGGRCSSGVRIGVGDAVLELIYLGPAVLGCDSGGQDLLVGVDNGVHDGGQGGEVGGQRDGGDGGNSAREGGEQLRLLDVKNLGREGVAIIVHLADAHSVGEGRDVKHVQQGSLGGSDLGISLNELELGGNFNGTTGNLGGDTKSLEERGLSGFHSSVSRWDEHIGRGDGTGTSRCGDGVGKNHVTNGLEVGIGEDETNVALDERKETLVLRVVVDKALDGTANLN